MNYNHSKATDSEVKQSITSVLFDTYNKRKSTQHNLHELNRSFSLSPVNELGHCEINYNIYSILCKHLTSDMNQHLIHVNNHNSFSYIGDTKLVTKILNTLLKHAIYQITENQHGEIFITTTKRNEKNQLIFRITGNKYQEVWQNILGDFAVTEINGEPSGLGFCKQAMLELGGELNTCITDGYIDFRLSFPQCGTPDTKYNGIVI